MNKKDDKPTKEKDPLSSSAQIFEDIFKEATQTVEKSGGEKPKQDSPKRSSTPPPTQTKQASSATSQKKQPPSSPAQRQTRTQPQNTRADSRPDRKAAQPRREEPKSKPSEKLDKRISPLKIVLLVVLLAVLAGALVNYLGLFDVSAVSELLGLGKKEPPPPALKQQVPKVQAASQPASKKPVDTAALAKKEEGKGNKEVPSSPSVQGKEGSPPFRVETAKPTAPAPIPETASTRAPAPAPAAQVKEGVQELPKRETAPATAAQVPQAAFQVSQPSPPSPPQASSKAVKAESPQPSAQAKPAGIAAPAVPLEIAARYPYSVYLGSYQTQEMAQKAISSFNEEGYPAYWSKVRLGDKGVWYRVFAGFFRNEAEAQSFVSSRQIKDAEIKLTKYSVLLGVFATRAEAEQKRSMMLQLGFTAYEIPEPRGRICLYSGAFLTKQGADIALAELASKGIKGSAVER